MCDRFFRLLGIGFGRIGVECSRICNVLHESYKIAGVGNIIVVQIGADGFNALSVGSYIFHKSYKVGCVDISVIIYVAVFRLYAERDYGSRGNGCRNDRGGSQQ